MEHTDQKSFTIHGFCVQIISKPAFELIGFTRPVNLDGHSIGDFFTELAEQGKLSLLKGSSAAPRQIWACLSEEGDKGFDCRCTVCVEAPEGQELLNESGLFRKKAPASQWAVFEVGEHQSPRELHEVDVYKMAAGIGYRFNWEVGFHLDNQHEWGPGKTMRFWLPVVPGEE